MNLNDILQKIKELFDKFKGHDEKIKEIEDVYDSNFETLDKYDMKLESEIDKLKKELKKIDKIADENFETLDKELEKLKEENNELKEKVKNLENLINFNTLTIPEVETPKLTMRKNWSEEENQMLISHWKKGKSIQFIKEEVLPEKTYDSIITKINLYIKNKVIKQVMYDYSNDGKGYSDDERNYILEEVKNGTSFIEIAKYLKRKESAVIQKYYNLIKE